MLIGIAMQATAEALPEAAPAETAELATQAAATGAAAAGDGGLDLLQLLLDAEVRLAALSASGFRPRPIPQPLHDELNSLVVQELVENDA
jgi:hypothetical protein